MTQTLASPSRAPTSKLVVLLAVVLAVAPVLVLNQYIGHGRPYLTDEFLFASFGQQLLAGRTLYMDIWDNKPPGIYWVNAIAQLFEPGQLTGIVALTALAMAAGIGLFLAGTHRLYGQPTMILLAFIAPLFLTHQLYRCGSNRPGTWVFLFQMLALVAYLQAMKRDRRTAWWLLGLAVAGAVCFRQNGFGVLIGVALHQVVLLVERFVNAKTVLRRIGHILIGLAAGLLLQAVLVAATSDLSAAWGAIVAFNVAYFEPGMGSQYLPASGGWSWRDHLNAIALPLTLAAAVTLHWLLNWPKHRRGVPEDSPNAKFPAAVPRVVPWLLLWTLAEVWLAMIAPHHRNHYFIPVLPPFMLLAGRAAHLLFRDYTLLEGLRRRLAVIIAVMAVAYLMVEPVRIHLHELGRAFHNLDTEWDMTWMCREVAERTEPGDGILVFSYHPRVYWETGRFCGIKYMGTEKIWQMGQPVVDDFVEQIKRRRPVLIVLHEKEHAALATSPLWHFGDLQSWLDEHYRSQTIGRYMFLQPAGRPAAPQPGGA